MQAHRAILLVILGMCTVAFWVLGVLALIRIFGG